MNVARCSPCTHVCVEVEAEMNMRVFFLFTVHSHTLISVIVLKLNMILYVPKGRCDMRSLSIKSRPWRKPVINKCKSVFSLKYGS